MNLSSKIQKCLVFELIIIFILFSNSNIFSANWYVNNSATGNNTGKSWIDAWQTFSDISGLTAGDTVYISGGMSSKVYNETLICTEGVTYKIGQEPGHNGIIIIDAQDIRANCIVLDQNVTISGQVSSGKEKRIICRNSTEHGVFKRGASFNIKLFYLEIHTCGNSDDKHGIRLSNPKGGCEIAHCSVHDNYYDGINCPGSSGSYGANRIHHCDIYNNSDDGINLRGGFDIYNNTIHDNWQRPNVSGKPHPDGIQAQGKYLRIYNNELYNNYTYQIFVDQINISAPEQAGYVYIYNNICYLTDKTHILNGIGIAYKAESSVTGNVTDVLIFNNTIVDMGYSGITIHSKSGSITKSFIKNNIIVNCRTSGSHGFVCGTSNTSGVEIDYNVINPGSSGGNRMEWGRMNYHYSDFVINGYGQQHGQISMPSFESYAEWNASNLQLKSSDIIARDNGVDMSFYSNTDKDGKPRPQGNSWDIGAYEFHLNSSSNHKKTDVFLRQ